MSVAMVREVATRFLKKQPPGVMVIKGAWGVGKTHLWNDLIRSKKDTLKPVKYSYVSLFGLKNLKELKTAVFANTIPASAIGEKMTWSRVNEKWFEMLQEKWRALASMLGSHTKEMPVLRHVSIPIDAVAAKLTDGTIVCLDDFERAGIESEEILGYITSLKEERNCKVVLIFNASKLGEAHKASYAKYREKVVDVELLYEPTAEEAAAIGIPDEITDVVLLRSRCKALGIRNIRILRRIVDVLQTVAEPLTDCHRDLCTDVISSIVLLTWIQFGEDEASKPSIEFWKQWTYGMGWAREGAQEVMDTKQRWASTLESYGYSSVTDLDLAIQEVIERGYCDGTPFLDELATRNAQLCDAELDRPYAAAWNLFHFSFANNREEVVNALDSSFRDSARRISPLNLGGTVRVLRELGENGKADALIENYIEQRKDEKEIFNLREDPFAHEIRDDVIRRRFAEAYASLSTLPSLLDAILDSYQGRGLSDEQKVVLEGASQAELRDLLLSKSGIDDLGTLLKACRWHASLMQSFGPKFHGALSDIGALSLINSVRVRQYGVQILHVEDLPR